MDTSPPAPPPLSHPTLTHHYPLAVIGAGAAGLSVAYAAARLGVRVVLVERAAMGGECLNTGCIPSKALLAAARQGHTLAAAQAHIKAAIAAIAPVDSAARYQGLGATIIPGQARFTGPNSFTVNATHFTARRIVIATGSRPFIPAFCAGLPHLTNETIWNIPALPGHLLILGGGPMALEMADAFTALNTRVTLITGPHPLAREDPALVATLLQALRAKGVAIIQKRATGASPGPTLVLDDASIITGTHLLIATGREFDATALNLAAANITATQQGIVTDNGLRCLGNKAIFAAGDAANPQNTGPHRFTHVAGQHAGIIIRRALFRLPAKLPSGPPVRVTYTSPELAQVGLTAAQAGPGARTLAWPFAENDRAIAEGNITGQVKLILNKNARLVGAGIVGPGAGELISLYALMLAQNIKLSALAALTLPYPTRAEAGKRAANILMAKKLFAPLPSRLVKLLAHLP